MQEVRTHGVLTRSTERDKGQSRESSRQEQKKERRAEETQGAEQEAETDNILIIQCNSSLIYIRIIDL